MKKILAVLLILTMSFVLLIQSWGAGSSVVQSLSHSAENFKSIVFSWTADDTDGSVPAATSSERIDGYIHKVITNPGTTAPSANYDITLTNTDGADVVHGELANRHATTTQEIIPVPADNVTVHDRSAVIGRITLNITNNSVNDATGTVTVIFSREGF